jgi:DNA-binding PadR family transcriptional regulator
MGSWDMGMSGGGKARGPWGMGSWGGPWPGGFGGPGKGGMPGPPPWMAGLFGLAQGEQQRGPRARRGDVRAAILALLAEEPRNGYQIIQELTERTDGVWQPSPGSIYPALQQLEDEGLVRQIEVEGRKAYELTEAGRTYVEERQEEIGAPWETIVEAAPESEADVRDLGRQLFIALVQLSQAGSEKQVQEAKQVLVDARKAIYRILAEEE